MAAHNLLKEVGVVFFLVTCLCNGIFGLDLSDKCGDVLPGCFCTDYYIDCQGAEFQDIREIYPFITKQTYRIRMTDGNLVSIPGNVFTNDELIGPLTELKYLNLSGNGIVSIDGAAFQELPNLKTLDLSNNDVIVDSCDSSSKLANIFNSLMNIEYLSLHNTIRRKTSEPCGLGFMFSSANMSHLTSLDISDNGFDIIDEEMKSFLCETYTLTSLNVSYNLMTSFQIPLCSNNLKMLDLSMNQISYLDHVDVEIIESFVNLESIRFRGNPFHCECSLAYFIFWVNETNQPIDADHITCASSTNSSLIGHPIKGLEYAAYCEPMIAICYGPRHVVRLAKPTFIGIVAGGLIVAVIIISSVIYCRRRSRRQHKTTTTTTKMGAESSMTGDVSKNTLYSRMV
ncbi:hypothetical protein ACF0H5_008641 [Mactra antiquata]